LLQNKSWSWWTLNDLKQLPAPPNVVLLGSSLMVAAIAECDANFKHKVFDLAYYRDAAYLSHALQLQFGGSFTTANLSAPGQMPSDAYLTLSAALKRGVAPRIVVYGLAPRDFLDGTMQSPSDTEAFQVLKHFVDVDGLAFDYYANPYGKLDWLMQKCFPLYQQAVWTRGQIAACARGLIGKEETKPTAFALSLRQRCQPQNVERGTFLALPTRPGTPLLDNTRDYKQRYKNPSQSNYLVQLKFLQRVAQLCRRNQIDLVLVQMPITKGNVDLLQPGVYKQYQTDISRLAADNSVTLLDMCQFGKYEPTDYKDSVHLNGYGGKKFVDNLVADLSATRLANDMVVASKSTQSRSIAAGRSGL
jgi:hypothetical protein